MALARHAMHELALTPLPALLFSTLHEPISLISRKHMSDIGIMSCFSSMLFPEVIIHMTVHYQHDSSICFQHSNVFILYICMCCQVHYFPTFHCIPFGVGKPGKTAVAVQDNLTG